MDVPDQPPQRVLVLYNAPAAVPAKGVAGDAISEEEVVQVAASVAEALESRGHEAVRFGLTRDLSAFLHVLDSARPDVVFNLCEGIDGDEHHESLVVGLLEFRGVPYTGCPARCLLDSNDKQRAKLILAAAGIPVPASWVVTSPADLDRITPRYPVIVKPVNENASLGITRDSVVREPGRLAGPVTHVLENYRQPALVERYVEGREFNVSVIGCGELSTPGCPARPPGEPTVLPISEIDYSSLPAGVPRILFYEAKWLEDSPYFLETPVVCPAELDEGLAARIRDIARRAYVAMGCRGYARVDFRVSRRGHPYVLEVNGNPSLAPTAGLARSARQAGLEYPALVERIVREALGRVDNAVRPHTKEVVCEERLL